MNWKKRSVSVGITSITALGVLASCGKAALQKNSQLQSVIVDDFTAADVQEALAQNQAILINLTSNEVTYYESGRPIDTWNIATADVSGEFHNGYAKVTPTGIYDLETITRCPTWRPQLYHYNDTGRVAFTQAELEQEFASKPEVYGACGSENPLGKYVMWFWGPYGFHGNNAEYILNLPAEERRVTGGCVRNPNARIQEIFGKVLARYEASGSAWKLNYVNAVRQSEQSANPTEELESDASGLNFRVVVGKFPASFGRAPSGPAGSSVPQPGAVPSPAPAPQATPKPAPARPAECTVVRGDSDLGVARAYYDLPEASSVNYDAFIDVGETVLVLARQGEWAKVRVPREQELAWVNAGVLGNCR